MSKFLEQIPDDFFGQFSSLHVAFSGWGTRPRYDDESYIIRSACRDSRDLEVLLVVYFVCAYIGDGILGEEKRLYLWKSHETVSQ